MIARILVVIFCFTLSTSMYGQQDNTYVVKKKDTVYGIAKKYGVTIDSLPTPIQDSTLPALS